jgi:hypothetical protein
MATGPSFIYGVATLKPTWAFEKVQAGNTTVNVAPSPGAALA